MRKGEGFITGLAFTFYPSLCVLENADATSFTEKRKKHNFKFLENK
jgi:hypothetical protein